MRKALTYICFIDMIFILFLAFSGTLGELFYYLAFLVPFLLAFFLRKNVETDFPKLKISKKDLALTLPTVAPTLLFVFLLSFLTSLALSFFGEGSTPDVSGNLALTILRYAVLTALLEEVLFRYIPLAFITPHTKQGAVLISSALFALSHCNLYQIPYAFFAGIIFAILDIAFDSVWPSVIIHFLNNLISVLWLRFGENREFALVYIGILIGLALVSLVFLIIFRKDYKEKIYPILSDKSKYKLSYEPIIFAVMTLIIAITNLFGGAS